MINRNSYRSLLESVQEAVAPATAGIAKGAVRKTRRSPASQSAPAAGQNLQWGDKAIGGAMNAMELAQWLNNQSGGMAVSSGGSVTPSTSPTAKVVRRTAKPKPSTTAGISEAEVVEDEDFDLIDEILAEGLELYGEEELAEILADFEQTGELSEELLDLISETDSMWLSRSAEKKPVAKKKA